MSRNSSFAQLVRLVGILPKNMFLEISKYSIFLKFPISIGRTPVNWLLNKSRLFGENKRPISCEDVLPVRLLLERLKINKFQH